MCSRMPLEPAQFQTFTQTRDAFFRSASSRRLLSQHAPASNARVRMIRCLPQSVQSTSWAHSSLPLESTEWPQRWNTSKCPIFRPDKSASWRRLIDNRRRRPGLIDFLRRTWSRCRRRKSEPNSSSDPSFRQTCRFQPVCLADCSPENPGVVHSFAHSLRILSARSSTAMNSSRRVASSDRSKPRPR